MTTQPKSFEEHLVFTEQLARLSFFYARKFLSHRFPDKSIGILLRDHTPLLYHALNFTDFESNWNNPECLTIIAKANRLANLSPEVFEEEMWSFVAETAHRRVEEIFPMVVGIQPFDDDYLCFHRTPIPRSFRYLYCGSLRYEEPAKGSDLCTFHIANAPAPSSLFQDSEYLPLCLKTMMKEAELRYGCTRLTTTTWLNDRPRWLRLFPDEWQRNLTPRLPDGQYLPVWSIGAWGQFIDARGMLEPSRIKEFRANGIFRYQQRTSQCSFESLRKHLERL